MGCSGCVQYDWPVYTHNAYNSFSSNSNQNQSMIVQTWWSKTWSVHWSTPDSWNCYNVFHRELFKCVRATTIFSEWKKVHKHNPTKLTFTHQQCAYANIYSGGSHFGGGGVDCCKSRVAHLLAVHQLTSHVPHTHLPIHMSCPHVAKRINVEAENLQQKKTFKFFRKINSTDWSGFILRPCIPVKWKKR